MNTRPPIIQTILILVICALSLFPCFCCADQVELKDGTLFHATLKRSAEGFHYFTIPVSSVTRVSYGDLQDTLYLAGGGNIPAKITGLINDLYYFKLPRENVAQVSHGNLPSPGPDTGENDAFSTGLILKLSGSNTIGAKLAPKLARAYLASIGANNIQAFEEDALETIVQGKAQGKTVSVRIRAHGSSTAFTDLAAGNCDIGMASRKIKPDEVRKLSGLGEMESQDCEHVLGIDGIAVIVNKSNFVFKIDKSTLKGIFTGKIDNWARADGQPGKPNIYARDQKSGTFDSFRHLVLEGASLASSAKRFEDSVMLANAVAGDQNGIGFVGLPYVNNTKALAISDGGNPVAPDKFTIATEDYPLSRRLYLYTPRHPKNPHVKRFSEFALSASGQDIVDETGFVGLNLEAARPAVADSLTPAYKKAIQGLERVSTNFRFRISSYNLDNRALRDLKRIADMLRKPEFQGKSIYLFGFTDSTGPCEMNQTLSVRRASTVRRALINQGVNVPRENVKGFGETNPVASNRTAEGRERNRRVEVWIR